MKRLANVSSCFLEIFHKTKLSQQDELLWCLVEVAGSHCMNMEDPRVHLLTGLRTKCSDRTDTY